MAVYAIVGIRRSGIHAIQSYIEEQLGDGVLILNDAYPELNYWYHRTDIENHNNTIIVFEDKSLGKIKNSRIFGHPVHLKVDHTILVLRDALNMMASRYKQFIDMASKRLIRQRRLKMMFRLRTAARLYARYADEFTGETNHLDGAIKVNFNQFVRNAEHRAELGSTLGLPHPEYYPQKVQNIAGGSSFDYLTKSGSAHEMLVLDRWKHFEGDSTFWKYFQTDMLICSKEIFGIPEVVPDIAD